MSFNETGIHNLKHGAFIINKPEAKSKIAAFDLDHTLIRPLKGRWPDHGNPNDYTFINDKVKSKLQDLYKNGYKIVVFTNQSGAKFNTKIFKQKIDNIAKDLEIELQVFGCTKHGYCRKPSIGLWRLLTRNNQQVEINLYESFYVGDAYPGAFSDSDLKFALNIGIDFYTPEVFFSDNPTPYNKQPPQHPLAFIDYGTHEFTKHDSQEIIILVGPPASGKSTYAKLAEKEGYVVVSQDDLGTKSRVINEGRKALRDGKSLVIDRKNEYIEYREEFLEIAKEFELYCRVIWFDISRELSEHLSTYREITTGKHIPSIVFNKYYSKNKGMEIPTINEGFDSIERKVFLRNDDLVVNKQVFEYYLI